MENVFSCCDYCIKECKRNLSKCAKFEKKCCGNCENWDPIISSFKERMGFCETNWKCDGIFCEKKVLKSNCYCSYDWELKKEIDEK